MADDRDLASILPEAPPPRPAKRAAAIEAALRRFDGEEVDTSRTAPPPLGRPGWHLWQPASALASVALVAGLSFPLWRSEQPKLVPRAIDIAAAPADVAPGTGRFEPEGAARIPELATDSAAPPAAAEIRQAEAAAPVPPPPAAPPAAAAPADAASRARAEALPPPPASQLAPAPAMEAPPAAADDAESEETAAGSIVVTGTRAQQRQVARVPLAPLTAVRMPARGDWNACTVDDPAGDLARCRDAVAGAPAAFAEGLSAAWRGDLDTALASFDAVVRRARGFAPAYLNRGLVHARAGDLARATADLDRAIRIDPNAARAYYHRSLIHARNGEAQKAQGDARRALRLDPAYRAVLR